MDDRQAMVARIRHFNRFYTRTVGLLDETLTRSAYTLTEARVLFELGYGRAAEPDLVEPTALNGADLRNGQTASDISRQLRLDPAYLTRILRKFAGEGLTETATDAADRRKKVLSLTAKGEAALAALQVAADRDATRLIESLPSDSLQELGSALRTAEALLGGTADGINEVVLRPHRIGDVGWVVQRQARLYADEYGWNIEFEAMLAQIGCDFIRNFLPGRDFCWIAELGGKSIGAVFLVHVDDELAKLRLLHVEPSGRGRGIGKRLVAECVRQARACGYRRLSLWTNDVLVAARKIYEGAGFQLISQQRHHSFGKDLTGQTWELEL